MTDNSPTGRGSQLEPQQESPKRKKPYVKPSFEREQVFETRALVCGKVSRTQASCHGFNRRNS